MRRRTDLEQLFKEVWSQHGDGDAMAQVIFHPVRGWLFDFAWIDRLIAIEINGGTWIHGGHSRGAGQRDDYEKHNAATLLGWRIFYCTTDMLQGDPAGMCDQINQLLATPVLTPDAERNMWIARVRSLTHDGMSAENNGIKVSRYRLRKYEVVTHSGKFNIAAEAYKVAGFIVGDHDLTLPIFTNGWKIRSVKYTTNPLFIVGEL